MFNQPNATNENFIRDPLEVLLHRNFNYRKFRLKLEQRFKSLASEKALLLEYN